MNDEFFDAPSISAFGAALVLLLAIALWRGHRYIQKWEDAIEAEHLKRLHASLDRAREWR